jgi:hypothetical protein
MKKRIRTALAALTIAIAVNAGLANPALAGGVKNRPVIAGAVVKPPGVRGVITKPPGVRAAGAALTAGSLDGTIIKPNPKALCTNEISHSARRSA